MSYLDRPRFHFVGEFMANPATLNNDMRNYASITTGPPLSWNDMGLNHFQFENCIIKTVIDDKGKSTPADALVGGTVALNVGKIAAKLVDIDPEFQTASAIWGAEVQIRLKGGGGSLTGAVGTATLRDLYPQRTDEGFAAGFGGVFQTAFNAGFSTNSISSSPVLSLLSKGLGLAIKFVTYAYNATPGAQNFTRGKVVGTIGPFGRADGEVPSMDLGVHFLHARRMWDDGSGFFGSAPFKLNSGKKRLTIDLGNCIPEVRGTGNERQALGKMEAVIVMPPPIKPVVLGELDFSKKHYELTAGIEELDLIPAEVKQLEKNPLGIRTKAKGLVMVERPKGLYIDATEIVFRAEPNTSSTIAVLVATEFGIPKAGVKIELKLLNPPIRPGGPQPTGLSFPASVTTGADGVAAVVFKTTVPSPKRLVDGQLFRVGFHDGPPGRSTLQGSLLIKVYDEFVIPAAPVYADVKAIMDQYARLYPFMNAILKMDDQTTMKNRAAAMIRTMELAMDDPSFMPVTRDLSAAKTATILKWLKAGAQ